MKKVQKIIYQDLVGPLTLSLTVLTFVVFTREFGRVAELLIRKSVELATVVEVVADLLPNILIFTIPFGFLIGTLIGFSRLSADSEIVALRAGGVSLGQMLWPVLKVGCVVSVVTALLTLYLLPKANWELRLKRRELRVAPVHTQLKPRVFFEEFPGMLLYVDDIDFRQALWEGIFLADQNDGQQRVIVAETGRAIPAPDGSRIQIHFENGVIYQTNPAEPTKDNISRFGSHDLTVELPEAAIIPKSKRPADKTLVELRQEVMGADPELARSSLAELNRRVALPLAPLVFSLLAVALGIRSHRGGRGYGFLVSIVAAFIYYVLFATGSVLARDGVLPVVVGVWGANVLTTVVALVGFRYASREGLFKGNGDATGFFRSLFFRLRKLPLHLRLAASRFWSRTRSAAVKRFAPGLRIARVLDLMMIRSFCFYFVSALLTCSTLFYLFTFFELVDDVFLNQTSALLPSYFFYLFPHILVLLVPISTLIATLMTLISLEKTNQVVAFKACGVSIYHLAGPIILVGLIVVAGMFVLQEQVLPYANQRQDTLRNLIKGSPVQTSQPGRRWIFGEERRLFNYAHFNPDRNVFGNLSVFQLEIGQVRIMEHLYAQRAVWDADRRMWRLEQGWRRNLIGNDFEQFQERDFEFSESPQYFQEEVASTSKMSYSALSTHIEVLEQGGFEVDYLKTELFKKISFPLVSLIMVVLGAPFALMIGKKGALYGVGTGVLLGIVYWGVFGIFDVLGANGLLAPVLAAWAPNLLFGSGALLLLSTTKT